MTGVSAEGRITHGGKGMWNDTQGAGWMRIVKFVHERSNAKIGMQLAHAHSSRSDARRSCAAPSGDPTGVTHPHLQKRVLGALLLACMAAAPPPERDLYPVEVGSRTCSEDQRLM